MINVPPGAVPVAVILSARTGPGAELRGALLEFCPELIRLSQSFQDLITPLTETLVSLSTSRPSSSAVVRGVFTER